MRSVMAEMVYSMQEEICQRLSEIEQVGYREDEWVREEGGGGRSRVFSDVTVF